MDILLGGSLSDLPEVYTSRSPLHHASAITCPVLIIQGADDKVVPRNQAELMVDEIKKKNGVVEYLLFEGEGHGWRKAGNIKRAIEGEMEFYTKNIGI